MKGGNILLLKRLGLNKGARFVAPLFILLLLFFNVPLFAMLGRSFSNPFPSIDYYTFLVNNPVYLQVMFSTFKIAVFITIYTVLLGYPLAYWITTLPRNWQLIVVTLVVMSFLVSMLVRAYAWIVLLGNNGILNSILIKIGIISEPMQFLYNNFGVNLGTLNILLPFLVIPLYFSMLKIDNRLMKAASSLGANPIQAFLKVYFPLTIRATVSSAILVFILTLGFFITPAILGGGKVTMIANVLDMLINQMSNWELASALSVVLLFITILFYYFSRKIEVIR